MTLPINRTGHLPIIRDGSYIHTSVYGGGGGDFGRY